MKIHPKRLKQLRGRLLWLVGSVALVFLVAAAIRYKRNSPIQALQVRYVQEAQDLRFIDEQDVRDVLFEKFGHYVEGQPASKVDIAAIEQVLEQNLFVRKADVYIDAWNHLNLAIEQRQPLLRVMDFHDESYYLDAEGTRIPVSSKYTARALVATGDIGVFVENFAEIEENRLRKVFELARYIQADEFLQKQIDHIHVEPSGFAILMPKLGDHQIYFGTLDEEVPSKFERLKIFYREGLPYEGWNQYKVVNIAYHNQIVARKR